MKKKLRRLGRQRYKKYKEVKLDRQGILEHASLDEFIEALDSFHGINVDAELIRTLTR
jgi:DUF1365 family protein